MQQEHQPWDAHSFHAGSDADTSKEILGAEANGKYVYARNCRIRSSASGGSNIPPTKIGGEEILFPNNLPPGDYKCLLQGQVQSHHVEVWADQDATEDSLIRVDGVIVLQSPDFAVTVADPPQWDINERCAGGEVCITALSFTPLILNIQDMVDALSTDPDKYFSGFDPAQYEVNLNVALDHPVFIGLVNVGGGGGRPPGLNSYSIRYVNGEGDRTNFSVETPLIPVVQNLDSASDQFPYGMTYGGPPNPEFRTRYGVHIRFRVNNLHNYDYIEIRRTTYVRGAGLGFTPTSEIIAKINVANEEVGYRDFVDPADANVDPPVAVSDADETQQLAFVEGAKTPRYLDRRLSLMNVELASKVSELQFTQIAGREVHPVMENLGTAGFGDTWNFVNRRHLTGGEKITLAVVGYDGVFGQGFAQKMQQNYQSANRRDIASATTQLYSYGGTVKAATVSQTVDQTHEVFDLTNAVAKTDVCSFKNIYQRGDAGTWGYKIAANVTEHCNETNGEIENHGAHVTPLGSVFPFFHPYTPTGANDTDTTGHNYVVNTQVSPSGDHAIDAEDYRPQGFAPNIYSQGLLVAGVTNFPRWMKSFSIVRTDVAKRVIAQGIGTYSLNPAVYNLLSNDSLATKDTDKVWFFSPDIENGIVSSDVVNDIIANPQNYKVQFVSPLGFYSEVYNFEATAGSLGRDKLVDMMTYANMLRDNAASPTINPGEDPAMGIPGGDGFNYVAYAKYRNTTQQPGLFAAGNGGNNAFQVAEVERITEGRGTYLGLRIQPQSIYGRGNTGGTSDHDFDDQGMKDFTEPLYIINIIQEGADIPDQNIQSYRNIHYQKLESIIGRGTGAPDQQYLLVDERWEDCISALDGSHPTAATDRFLYVRHPNGVEEKWYNVTFFTAAQRLAINNFILTNGAYTNGATGTYTHTNSNNREFAIVFDQAPFYPADRDLIIVKYDDTAPIRCWGGDAVVGSSIFAPIDREADAYDDAATTQFAFGIGFPFREWQLNPRHYVVQRTTGVNRIQDQDWFDLGYIRQMCMSFIVESRAVLPYSFNLDYPLQYFPLINYVMRPNRWDASKSIADQNIYQEYVDTYGEQEKSQWKWGGFRFRQNINPEYSNEQKKRSFSEPDYGFTEQTRFCTRSMVSLPRAINVQNAPGIRTFAANNAFDIDDQSGEIKRAYAEINAKGENLYAITEKGVCLLLTNKSILSDLNGSELAYMATTSYVKGQYWISRTQGGMNDQMWRTTAEGTIPVGTDQSGGQQMAPALFYANSESMYLFFGAQPPFDIGRAGYYSRLRPYLDAIREGVLTHVSGFYDENNQEYWLHIFDPPHEGQDFPITTTIVYSPHPTIKAVSSEYDYQFDRFAMSGKEVRATRDGETYVLERGFEINGAPARFELTFASSQAPTRGKEFIRFRANSDQRPTRIEFLDVDESLLCAMDQAIQGQYYLKNYNGYEQGIPRKDAPPRDRVQGRVVLCKVIHDEPSAFVMHTAEIQYKLLK